MQDCWCFKWNSCDGSMLDPTGQAAKAKLSPIKNPDDVHIHNSFSNVVAHMPYINIHHANWKWFCMCTLSYLRLQWVTHCADLTAISCFCSKIKRHSYVANSCLIGDTCTVISTWQIFRVKIFSWGTLEIYLHEYLTHEYFHTHKFPDLCWLICADYSIREYWSNFNPLYVTVWAKTRLVRTC